MKRPWLKDWPWETVVTINAGLCQEKKALPQPTADGYAPARKLWEKSCGLELTLREVLDLCRQCHKFAPFCFYNGNTFAAIGWTLIQGVLGEICRRPGRTLSEVPSVIISPGQLVKRSCPGFWNLWLAKNERIVRTFEEIV